MKPVKQIARRIALVLFALCGVGGLNCVAAPLVLQGTATIATVQDDASFPGIIGPLPFAAQVGDAFTFSLSIESQTPAPGRPSGHATFQAEIGGADLSHSILDIFIRNNSGVSQLTFAEPRDIDAGAIVGDAISIEKPDEFADAEYLGTTDIADTPRFKLELGFMEYVPRISPEELQVYPAILNDRSVPQDAATWQAFSDRELAIRFENLSFVGAYINAVTAVPEPSSFSICSYWCLYWLKRRLAGNRPKHIVSKSPRRSHAE
jgi:hypothetical protein